MKNKKILIVGGWIRSASGVSDATRNSARITSDTHYVDVFTFDAFQNEINMRGREYDLIILPADAQGHEEARKQAGFLVARRQGQVIYQ